MGITSVGRTLLALVLAPLPAVAAADTQLASEYWLQGLLAGRDLSGEARAYADALRPEFGKLAPAELRAEGSLRPPRAELRRALVAVGAVQAADRPWQLGDRLERFKASVGAALSARAALEARAEAVLTRTLAAGLAEDIVERARQALATIAGESARMRDAGGELLAASPGKLQSVDAERRWRRALDRWAALLQRSVAEEATPPILRALPYAERLPAPGPPILEPAIAPSYADSRAAAGGPDDLAAGPNAPLSQAILGKAAELKFDYIAIYNFVRLEIRTDYYAGAMKGAEGVLRSGSGNDLDQASLLIALLRAARVPARYVHGVIELPLEIAAAPLGLPPGQALDALNRAGIANEPVIRGGQVAAVRMAHTWVSAFVPYANYRGAAVDLSGPTWLPLAPAIKDYRFTEPALRWSDLGLAADVWVRDYLEGQIAGSPLEAIRQRVTDYLTANPGLGGYADQLTQVRVDAGAFELLPSSLPFEVVAVTRESTALTEDDTHRLRISIPALGAGPGMAVTLPLPRLLGHRVTLSYAPATVEDYNAIREFGGMALVPAYLVRLRPQISIDGRPVASASGTLPMGMPHALNFELISATATTTFERRMLAGAYAAISVGAGTGEATPEPLQERVYDDQEFPAAKVLGNLGAIYTAAWDEAEAELASLMNLAVVRPYPSVSLLASDFGVLSVDGLPFELVFSGASLDAALRSANPLARGGGSNGYDYLRFAGLAGSALEAAVFADQWVVEAISADRGLQLGAAGGDPPVSVDAGNAAAILPTLNHPLLVIEDIRSWVDRGFRALVPSGPVTLNAWRGSVWHVWDARTGGTGYFISGGYAGGQTSERIEDWLLQELVEMLANPYGDTPNNYPLAAAELVKVTATDFQIGQVNQPLERPLAVLVRDVGGRPVTGALLVFRIVSGDAELTGETATGPQVVFQTDRFGIAKGMLKLGPSTEVSVLGQEPGLDSQTEPTRFGEVIVAVSAVSSLGPLQLEEPFTVLARPDAPARLEVVTDFGNRSLPRGPGGDLSFRVVDGFGNSVSNVMVAIRGETPHECGVPITAPPASFIVAGDCPPPRIPGQASCAARELTEPSGPDPKRVFVVQGDGAMATAFPITLSAAGLATVEVESANIFRDVACASPDPIANVSFPFVSESFEKSRRGGSIEAALPGQTLPRERQARLFSMIPVDEPANGLSIRWAVGQAEGQVVYATDTLDEVAAVNAAAGEYAASLSVGSDVRAYPVQRRAENVNFQTRESDAFLGGFEALVGPLESAPVFAASARILKVEPEPLELSVDGYLLNEMTVDYEVLPETYLPEIEIRLYEDNNLLRVRRMPTGPNRGKALFPPGMKIDIERDYELELVLSAETDFEIRSERFTVPVTQSIVKRVNNISKPDFTLDIVYGGGIVVNGRVPSSLYVSNHIDIPNQLVCENRDFSFELSIPATVTITAARLDDSGSVTGDVRELMARTLLEKGEHLVEVTATELGTGDFLVLIDAESGVDSSREQIPVGLRSRFELTNSLPVGHAMVKGVDLYDGAMVLSRQDIEVPGPGSNLKFVRTYSSNGRFTPGVLGSGWSHNYLSRVIQSHCGDFTVTGGEGGSMRFVRDGTGFRPLKGYHGSLVQNADSSFDFYPKGGNRYHFSKRQSRVWWLDYIEDPSGNRTRFAYIDREAAPLIRQVTDPSGRSLVFEYQYRQFDQLQGDVLTRLRGPGGIELTLEYDQFGNQIRAARENDSLIEAYDYRVDAGTADRHLLKSATDVLTGSTRQYFYDQQTLITPVGNYPLDLSASSVRSIIEPDGGQTSFAYTPGPGGSFIQVSVTDARSQATVYDLNAYGAAVRIAAPNGVRQFEWETESDVLLLAEIDENGRRRAFRHDQFGNVTEERVGSQVRSYRYHDPGEFQPPFIKERVATYTNWRGLITSYDYDLAGNLVNETLDGVTMVYTYDHRGNRLSATDGNGNSTSFNYDSNGYLATQIDPEGNRVKTKWDLRGRKTEEIDANGNRTTMAYDERDRVRVKTTTLTLASGAGGAEFSERVIFDDPIRRRTEIDRNGNATVFDHDAMGRLATITNALGDTFEYRYDGNGNKLGERDWLGRDTTFEYDPANRLITKSEPEGRVTNLGYDPVGNLLREEMSGPQDAARVTEYAYDPDRYFQTEIRHRGDDGDALVVREYDGEGNVVRETDPLGRQTEFTYDAFNRRTLEQGPLGSGRLTEYDAAGNILTETTFNTPQDQVRQFLYDRANRQANQIDAEGGVSTFEYDGNGNVIRRIDPRGNATTSTYNELNLMLSESVPYTPLGGTPGQALSRFEYDPNGNRIAEIRPNGNRVEHAYDALNRKTAETDSAGPIVAYRYDAAGNVIAETDGNGNTASYDYDGLNRRIGEQRPLGRNREFAYTVFGELKAETDAAGNRISHSIDALGRRVASVGPLGLNLGFEYDLADNLKEQTDGRGTAMNYDYNALNQRISETVASPGATFVRSFNYDLAGNRTSETDRRGIVSQWGYDKENRLTSFRRDSRPQETRRYDLAGNLLFVTDANGNTTGYRYDERNLVIEESRPELQITSFVRDAVGDVVVEDRPGARDVGRTYDRRRRLIAESNGAAETTTFEYDPNNNQIARVKPESTAHRWLFRYDAANRLEEIQDPLGNLTHYDYDARDNRIAQRDANNRATAFEYDARNRLTAKVYPDGARIEYGYDSNNNLRSVSEPNGNQAEYGYDALNRQIGQVFQNGASRIEVDFVLDGNGNPTQVDESVDGATSRTTRDYDALDRITRVTDRFGQTLQYAYDENGNRTTLLDHQGQRTEYHYDGLNRLDDLVVPGVGLFDYVYQSDGLLDAVAHPNGSRSEYDYDGADRIDTIRNTQSGEIVTLHDYDYDKNGNRTELSEQNGHGIEITRYAYDLADRLTEVTYPSRSVSYTLDSVGNRTEERITETASINTRSFAYNTRDQLIQVADTEGLAIDYGYDESGNQIEKTESGKTTLFAYSPRNRMTQVTPPSLSPINYRYDHNGLRVEKETNGNTTRYVNDDTALIAETNVLGNTLARYHYGPDRRLAETRATDNTFFLEDGLGTPVALTTQDGAIQTRYTYDAWGNIKRQQGASDQPFGFTGYQKDHETDLYYAQQRYYDAFTGRFTREDPFQGDINNPPSLHRYFYANANPTAFIDLTGQYAEPAHHDLPLYVAQRLGYRPEYAETIAFFAELPDEVDLLDAIETEIAVRLSRLTGSRDQDTRVSVRDIVHNGLHALSGLDSAFETELTIRAIGSVRDDPAAVGLLLHRLGDSFSHRRIENESIMYDTGDGHRRGGGWPDVIQIRTRLFDQYASALVAVLAKMADMRNQKTVDRLTGDILGELSAVTGILTYETELDGDVLHVKNKSIRQLQRESATAMRKLLEAENTRRAAEKLPPINLNFSPGDFGPNHINFFEEISLDDTLRMAASINSNLRFSKTDVFNSLFRALRALEKHRPDVAKEFGIILEGDSVESSTGELEN